jgi:hypothetical protein
MVLLKDWTRLDRPGSPGARFIRMVNTPAGARDHGVQHIVQIIPEKM